MAPPKKVQTYVKLQIEAGKATPAPPVGPALGQAQVNIMEFCKQFNERTSKDKVGKVTEKQVREIATQKMPDLNASSVETAIKSIKGTARSMGIEVVA